jgi:hypothetical protein
LGRRVRILFGALVFLGLAAGPGASSTRACISDTPSFAEAVAGADAIARVTIVDGTDYEQPGDIEVFRVDRVLKGDPGPSIELVEPVTYLCGDRVGYLTGGADGGVGESIILATNVQFFDEVIHPFWIVVDGGLSGSAGWPAAATDLADVEAAILNALGPPDTSTAPEGVRRTNPGSPTLPVVMMAASMVLAAVMLRRRIPWHA